MNWIKVSEKLPEQEKSIHHGRIWYEDPVVWAHNELYGVVMCAFCANERRSIWEEYETRHSDGGSMEIENVTHWMPIIKPEPPK